MRKCDPGAWRREDQNIRVTVEIHPYGFGDLKQTLTDIEIRKAPDLHEHGRRYVVNDLQARPLCNFTVDYDATTNDIIAAALGMLDK